MFHDIWNVTTLFVKLAAEKCFFFWTASMWPDVLNYDEAMLPNKVKNPVAQQSKKSSICAFQIHMQTILSFTLKDS